MALFDGIKIVRDGWQCIMGVKEDEVVLLHSYKIVCFLRTASNNSTVQLLHEERLYRTEVLGAYFLQAKPCGNKDKHAVAPISF